MVVVTCRRRGRAVIAKDGMACVVVGNNSSVSLVQMRGRIGWCRYMYGAKGNRVEARARISGIAMTRIQRSRGRR